MCLHKIQGRTAELAKLYSWRSICCFVILEWKDNGSMFFWKAEERRGYKNSLREFCCHQSLVCHGYSKPRGTPTTDNLSFPNDSLVTHNLQYSWHLCSVIISKLGVHYHNSGCAQLGQTYSHTGTHFTYHSYEEIIMFLNPTFKKMFID